MNWCPIHGSYATYQCMACANNSIVVAATTDPAPFSRRIAALESRVAALEAELRRRFPVDFPAGAVTVTTTVVEGPASPPREGDGNGDR